MIVLLLACALPTGLALFAGGFVVGRRASATERTGRRALWAYQQALQGSGHEIRSLESGAFAALSVTTREELLAARGAAYPHARLLPAAYRALVLAPTLPDPLDPRIEIDDVARGYLLLADALADGLSSDLVSRHTVRPGRRRAGPRRGEVEPV